MLILTQIPRHFSLSYEKADRHTNTQPFSTNVIKLCLFIKKLSILREGERKTKKKEAKGGFILNYMLKYNLYKKVKGKKKYLKEIDYDK